MKIFLKNNFLDLISCFEKISAVLDFNLQLPEIFA